MNSIWAVGRHTFAQCLRMKIAIAFLLLLAVSLTVLPFVMKGDGTLAGSIRTCLSYSVRMTGFLLSIVTVLVTVGVVSSDIRQKHIFLLASKPLARWEYLLGRWVGVVLLNAVLLGIAGVSIYFIAQHLRNGEATSPVDRRAVETEIFSARHKVSPEPADIDSVVNKRIAEYKKRGKYAQLLKDFKGPNDLPPEIAKIRLLTHLKKEELSKIEVASPGGWLEWKFKNIDIAGSTQQGQGKIADLNKSRGLYRIEVSTRVAGRLFPNGPVEINGVEGMVLRLEKEWFLAGFSPAEQKNAIVTDFRKDQNVKIVAQPMFQFRYKVTPIGKLPSEQSSLYRWLVFRKPGGKPLVASRTDGPIKTTTAVTIPAVKSLRKGDLMVGYRNMPPPATGPRVGFRRIHPVQISQKDVSILYRIGGFEGNFFRAMLLIFCQLVFLAAMGVFFGSFLSFSVAVLAAMVLLMCGVMAEWLSDAVQLSAEGEVNVVGMAGSLVLWLTEIIMPNLGETSPADKLVDGIYIPWWKGLGVTALWGVVVRTTIYLAVGCLIFHKRELAKVQV